MNCSRIATLLLTAAAFTIATPMLHAQRWEFGGAGGASFYNTLQAKNGNRTADVGFKTGAGGAAFLGTIGNRLGGEVRYTFMLDKPQVKEGSASYSTSGYSNTITYDMLVYTGTKASKARGYFNVGGGLKGYTASGASAIQPLAGIVVITSTTQWKPVLSFGGGARFNINPHFSVRAEVRAYMTGAPKEVLASLPSTELNGYFFDIIPMIALSYVW